MRPYNLHTHSWYCGHGEGTLDEYAVSALESGLSVLGFSEHLPYEDKRITSTMDYSQLEQYRADVKRCAGRFAPRGLRVLSGWECDWYPGMESWYETLAQQSDYLIFGNHYLVEDGRYRSLFYGELEKRELFLYADSLIRGMNSGLFTFVAHPDVFFFNYEKFDAEAKAVSCAIIDAAVDLSLPLEANGNGLVRAKRYNRAPYPVREFWDIAVDRNVKVVASTDAHTPANVARSLPLLDEFFSVYPGFSFIELSELFPDFK